VEDWNWETIFTDFDAFGQQLKEPEIGEKTQNKGYYVVQGNRGQYQSKPVCDFLLVINSN